MAGGIGRSLPKHSSLPGSTRKSGKRRVGGKSAPVSPWSLGFWLRPKTCLTALSVLFTFLFLFQGGFMATFFWNPSIQNPNSDGGGLRSSVGLKARKSESRRSDVGEAVVDITMKALYDKIAFDDRDGGVWKQGWDVRYKGSEWDQEKLKVFVVPHSHNDPGWIRTVEEYYQERTKHILDTIVASLLKDPRRRFIWEEMSYLERWWRDASEQSKKDFTSLVKSGQLEIVGGGWVMNDEANSHYFAIIEQMTAGNLWLLDNVGVSPKNAWAIDPFGHSPTMAYLLRRMGFENMLIQRTHYEVKKELAWNQNLEFNWRQIWDSENSTDIFCHMMPFYSYDIPHTCGPEPGVCCQFDFWRSPGRAGYCPWSKQPQMITPENVKERSELLLDQYRKKSILYKSNTLLIPLGDDFRYIEMAEADLAYENYQKIFDYVNSHPNLKAELQFGTLQDYFSTLRKEVSKTGNMKSESPNSPLSVPGFPSLAGDFFTYADIHQDYWSGYYVTRPFYKAVDRVLEQTLRAADILFMLAKAYRGSERSGLSGDVLERQRRNLALFQHHDGVTGTAKDHVVVDYANKMHGGIVELEALMAASVGEILTPKLSSTTHPFESVELRKNYDMLPVNKVVEVKNFEVQRVVFYNPLEETLQQVATVLVDNPAVCVFDSLGKSVESQLSPDWGTGVTVSTNSKNHRLHFRVTVAPLGLATYLITAETDNCDTASLSSLSVFNVPKDFECPDPYLCSYNKLNAPEHVSITNSEQTLKFSTRTGMLTSHWNLGGNEMSINEEIAMYTSSGSGAYLFRPSGDASPVVQPGGIVLVSQGPLMEEVYTVPKFDTHPPLVRSARLYAGKTVQAAAAEFEYYVDFARNEFNDRELITRFKTELNNNRLFYTDLNGFQTMRRETYSKIPLQGNYYPMPSLAFLQCPGGRRFSVHSRQALGVASLNKGELEIMLDRRLIHDDGRGLGQGIMDNRPSRVIFQLLVERNSTASSPARNPDLVSKVPSLLSHLVNARLNYPVHSFFDTPQPFTSIQATTQSSLVEPNFSPLRGDLPCDMHIVAMKVLRPSQPSSDEDLSHGVLLHRRGVDSSYSMIDQLMCETMEKRGFDLFGLFSAQFDITKLRKASLSFVHNTGSEVVAQRDAAHRKVGLGGALVLSSQELVNLNAMEIQAYKFDLKSVG
ncbi:hypothetical protein M758_12G017800 [Ceratodon purpureus]|uniref:Alpha-mannosidase n=1 Tax=Ceratodon purpureus TaxID=3225 RepID=A0A8T0G4Y0_CERPU|nr:hypothetical protein KC19_12G016900 [Ceratodon purpureus]KAG0597738.1 hypothetical protein M758_12G017800 [Ceratodon purpureus]